PSPSADQSVVVNVQLQDDGGTANSGVDISPNTTFLITIRPPFTLTTTSVNDGVMLESYFTQCLNTGGFWTGARTFNKTAGSLPPGITLDQSSGCFFGTPTAVGPYTFTVVVSDQSNPV